MRRVSFCLLLALAVALPAAPLAARAAAAAAEVSLTARDADVAAFVEQFYAETGRRAKVSASVKGKVNGQFRGSADSVWNQLSRAFNLVAFADGDVVRVYSADDVATRVIATENPKALVASVRKLGLGDRYNGVRQGIRAVSATGVPAFLDRVEALAKGTGGLATAAATALPPAPVPAVAGDIVTPLTPAAAASIEPMKIRSQVIRQADRRSPYEVRIFFLNYAYADDSFTRLGDRDRRTPGIASVLRGIMGDGRPSDTVRVRGDAPDNFTGDDYSDAYLNGLASDLVVLPQSAGNAEREPSAAPVRDVDGPRIEVDPTQNAVIVRDRPQAMPVYESIIASLDQPSRMVEIEATIIDVSIDALKELGIDVDIQVDGLRALFGGASALPTNVTTGANIAGSYVTGSGDIFAARITALEKNGALRVVSRPQLLIMDNRTALFDDSREIYVPVEGRVGRLERLRIGTVLRVTPSIVRERTGMRTQLMIDIEDGQPTSGVVADLPVLKRSRLSSQAIVREGESVLLGGLTVDALYDYKSKTPLLGDIPLLGQAFRKRRKGSQRVERLFLITPRVFGPTAPPQVQVEAEPIPIEVLEGKAPARRASATRRRKKG